MTRTMAVAGVPGISDPELLRPRVLRNLLELTDETPPLGERYEELLKELIFEAYQLSNGDLGEDEKQFLDDIFHYVAAVGPMERFFDDPQVDEVMVNGPNQIFIEKNGKLILTDAKYDSEIQLRMAINHIINPFGRYVACNGPAISRPASKPRPA